MEDDMLEKFNSRIKPGDHLYHLGDVCWSSYDLENSKFFSRLNTKQIHLVLGNHDNKPLSEYKKRFAWIGDYRKITINHQGVNGIQFILSHYPFRTWVGKGHGTYQLYGHVHGRMPGVGRQMDVGVDPNGFYPLDLDQVIDKLKNEPFSDGEA